MVWSIKESIEYLNRLNRTYTEECNELLKLIKTLMEKLKKIENDKATIMMETVLGKKLINLKTSQCVIKNNYILFPQYQIALLSPLAVCSGVTL